MSEEPVKAAHRQVSERGSRRSPPSSALRRAKADIMESPEEAFSQVVFTDIAPSYPPSTSITCHYTLSASLQPHSRDWVGIFKVGWSTAKDYHTFVWVEPCQGGEGQGSLTRQAVFKDYYLPKDDFEFYQFCYIDSAGQVRGASTPFCFKSPEEQSAESGPDDDLLVITTQEQVEQGVREKAELQRELEKAREEKEALESALQKQQQEVAILKGQDEEKEKEKSQLLRELDQIKDQNRNLQQQLQEMESLKIELQQQVATEQRRLSQSSSCDGSPTPNETRAQEKYDRAVMKINQQKEELKEQRGRVDAQSEEIAKLNCKLREGERELFKARDNIQILQVDLQSSEKEKERLAAELQRLQSVTLSLDEVRRENQELSRRLSQQQTELDAPARDLTAQCQTLANQLQDAQEKLTAERDKSRQARRRAEGLDRELEELKEQLENLNESHDLEQRTSGKYEFQLREALDSIADKDGVIEEQENMMRLVKHENVELARENQILRSNIDSMRRAYADLHADPPQAQPDATSPAERAAAGLADAPVQVDDLLEPAGNVAEPEEEQSLVCRHCQECFPGITRNELDQHEQSHRVCPFCTMLCDNMDQSVFEDHVYSHEL